MAKFCINKTSLELINQNVKHGRKVYVETCHGHIIPSYINLSHPSSSKASSKLGENIGEGPDLSDFIAGVVPRYVCIFSISLISKAQYFYVDEVNMT